MEYSIEILWINPLPPPHFINLKARESRVPWTVWSVTELHVFLLFQSLQWNLNRSSLTVSSSRKKIITMKRKTWSSSLSWTGSFPIKGNLEWSTQKTVFLSIKFEETSPVNGMHVVVFFFSDAIQKTDWAIYVWITVWLVKGSECS